MVYEWNTEGGCISMRAGRHTTDKKDSTVKLRLNDDMRNWIDSTASRKGISVSELLRQIIGQAMDRQ